MSEEEQEQQPETPEAAEPAAETSGAIMYRGKVYDSAEAFRKAKTEGNL